MVHFLNAFMHFRIFLSHQHHISHKKSLRVLYVHHPFYKCGAVVVQVLLGTRYMMTDSRVFRPTRFIQWVLKSWNTCHFRRTILVEKQIAAVAIHRNKYFKLNYFLTALGIWERWLYYVYIATAVDNIEAVQTDKSYIMLL